MIGGSRVKNIWAVWLMLSVFAMVGAVGAQETVRRAIQVRGQATMSVEPDVAYVKFGVETQGSTAAKAQSQLAMQASEVLNALLRDGVDRTDIKTSSYRVSPVYSTRQDKQNVIIGYKAETTLAVELSDLSAVAGMVDTAMNAGANAVRSLSYDRKDMQAFKSQLIQAACLDATMKAEAAASALGVELDAPISVDIQDSFLARETGNGMMAKSMASPDFLSPGELDISVSVSVEFNLKIK